MSLFRPLLPVTALLLLLGGAWWQLHRPPEPVPVPDGSRLEWSDCWFDAPWWRPVHCGWLTVPAGFRLPVVYLSAWFWRRSAPPVIYISGGPGGATGLNDEVMPAWFDWLDLADWPADLVLYDQRGVGLSRPAIDCPEVRDLRRALLGSDASLEEQYRQLNGAQRRCLARLRAGKVDLSRFHTVANADDVLALVGALGLPRWRLYGVSYGSRVALEVMRRNPAGLDAVVLDSVYPPEVHGEAEDAWLLDRALVMATRVCELLDCKTGSEQLRQWLATARARLATRPLRLTLSDPADGRPLPLRLDEVDLAWLLLDAQYDWHKLLRLPALLREVATGEPGATVRKIAQDAVEAELGDDVSEPVANSVECSDNGPLSEAEFERRLRQFPQVAGLKRLDWEYGPCRFWPRGPVPAAFRQPMHSTVPTLLLAGEFDPVTPPEWAERAWRGLGNGHLLIFPGMGHGVLDGDACAAAATRAFWQDPGAPSVPGCLSP